MFTQNRDQLRLAYLTTWQKMQRNHIITDALEQQIAQVLSEHPEYNGFFAQGEKIVLGGEYKVTDNIPNPFMHMGMHLAIRDQIHTDRPTGIAQIHRQLSIKNGSAHTAEHQMMDALAEMLWQAQQHQTPLNDTDYLAALQRLVHPAIS